MVEVLKAWQPCVERGLTCDGEYHRGWDGHDPYIARCPRPRPEGETYAHRLLGEFCACYGEACPADTCRNEAKKLADWLAANTRPSQPPTQETALRALASEYPGDATNMAASAAISWMRRAESVEAKLSALVEVVRMGAERLSCQAQSSSFSVSEQVLRSKMGDLSADLFKALAAHDAATAERGME